MECPQCHKTIEYLNADTLMSVLGSFDSNGFSESSENLVEMSLSCPECFEVLAENDEEGYNLFK